MRCVSLLHFSDAELTLGTGFLSVGWLVPLGLESRPLTQLWACRGRRVVWWSKYPHCMAGDLSLTLHSATKKRSLLILGVFLILSAGPQFPHL